MIKYWFAVLVIGITLIGCGSKKENDRDRFFLRGNAALAENSYDDAIKFYSEAIKIDPEYAIAFNNRGITYYEDDDLISSITDYTKAIRLDPKFSDAYFNRANSMIALGRYEEALEDLNIVKNAYPDSSYVYFALGLSYDGLMRHEEAIKSFQKSITLDPDNAETYLNLAVVNYHLKEYDVANDFLVQAFARDENNSNYYNIKALILMEQGDFTESINVFTDGLFKHQEDAFLLNNRGYAYLLMDSVELAAIDIDESILMNPANLWAYRNKGILAYKRGEYEKAERLLKRALDKRKYVEELYSYLGLTYLAMENTDDACKYLNLANDKGEKKAAKEFQETCQ